LEKAPSKPKDNRIKSLEDLVIELGHDPNDIKVVEKLIKKKNEDIVALKKNSNCLIQSTHRQKRSLRAKLIKRR